MGQRLIILLLLLLPNKLAFSHPHIFVDYTLEIKGSNLATMEWVFDPLESKKTIYIFDDNEDGVISGKEIDNLYNEKFIYLKDYNFFLYIKKGSNQITLEGVENFHAGVNEDGLFFYRFDFQIPEISDDITKLTLFDTTYYTSFSEPTTESVFKPDSIYKSIRKNRDTPYYYDPSAGPDVVIDTSKPQPGWLKVYPTEILLSSSPIKEIDDFSFYIVKERFLEIQKAIYFKLSDYLLNMTTGVTIELLLVLLLSLFYGFIHAIGPGHRKVVLTSYLLSKESSYKEAAYLSLLSALLHSTSGVIIVLTLYYIFDIVSDGSLLASTGIINSFSGVILLFLVAFITVNKIIKNRKKRTKREVRVEKAAILISSLIPCPGAATIMLVSISFNMIHIGVLSVLFMSIGIGVTLMIISLLALKGRGLTKGSSVYSRISTIIEWGALIVLLIFGLSLINLGGL